jgi:hypothetical protein
MRACVCCTPEPFLLFNLKFALVDLSKLKKGTLSLFFIMLLGLVEVLFKR